MNETATPARPPSFRQLEARVARLTKTRVAASEKLRRAHAAFNDAFTAFEHAMDEETLARGSLSLALSGHAPEPAPPAPETLTATDEED
jgi:hypothetical protein